MALLRSAIARGGPLAVLIAVAVSVGPAARGGHELPVYPSYYPHEIAVTAVEAKAAAHGLHDASIHAFVGEIGEFAPGSGEPVDSVASLGAWVLIKTNPDSPLARDEHGACRLAATLFADMRQGGRQGGARLIPHPYPVTPLHGDYLLHADLAAAALARLATTAEAPGHDLRVRAEGALANGLIPPAWRATVEGWDAAVTTVDSSALVAAATSASNALFAPRWVREGWYHAYRLLSENLADTAGGRRAKDDLERLVAGDYDNILERINRQRDLVTALTASCRTLVAGYTLKREYFNAEFSAGVENIGYDALTGFASPIFLRTVKLKDFPWNGWLRLGIDAPAHAAWNPVAGFDDAFGRLMWFAIGDAALLPSPYDAGWTLNRFSDVAATPRP
jgi:hypothetical protein